MLYREKHPKELLVQAQIYEQKVHQIQRQLNTIQSHSAAQPWLRKALRGKLLVACQLYQQVIRLSIHRSRAKKPYKFELKKAYDRLYRLSMHYKKYLNPEANQTLKHYLAKIQSSYLSKENNSNHWKPTP